MFQFLLTQPFSIVVPHLNWDPRTEDERRAGASAGLLSLIDPTISAAGLVNKLLDPEAEAADSRRIALRLDEKAKQTAKASYKYREKLQSEAVFTEDSLQLLRNTDAPLWRVRVRVSQLRA